MENQQQVSLADHSMRINKKQKTKFSQELIKAKFTQIIAVFVIILIILLNYLQLRTLRSNYENIQAILEDAIGLIEKNKEQLDIESINRIGNQTQLRDNLNGLISKNYNQFLQRFKENLSQMQKYKARMNKFNQILNKFKKQTENALKQDRQTPQKSKDILIYQNKSPNIHLKFLFQHSKDRFHSFKLEYFDSLLKKPIFNDEKMKQSFLTAFYNIKQLNENKIILNQKKAIQDKIYSRLSQQYQFGKYSKQLPFCIVVPTYNNAYNFIYEYNLQSIVNLDYKNYKIVIVDDASTDGTYQLLKQHIDQLQHNQNIFLIRNEKKMPAVSNINKAVRQYCSESDIVLLVDGGDQILVKYSLKVYNSIYQKQDAGVVYSNNLKLYWHQNQVYKGQSQDYSSQQKLMNMYRQIPLKVSHLKSFKASLFLGIKQQDLKQKNGQWIQSTNDLAFILPILQMSCGKIRFIEEYFYLYHFGIGTNDRFVDPDKQRQINDYVRHGNKYKCLEKL